MVIRRELYLKLQKLKKVKAETLKPQSKVLYDYITSELLNLMQRFLLKNIRNKHDIGPEILRTTK